MDKSVIHVYWQLRLAENKKMTLKKFKDFLSYYCIPRNLRQDIIEEMVQMKLVEVVEDKIIPINCDYAGVNGTRLTRRKNILKQVPSVA